MGESGLQPLGNRINYGHENEEKTSEAIQDAEGRGIHPETQTRQKIPKVVSHRRGDLVSAVRKIVSNDDVG